MLSKAFPPHVDKTGLLGKGYGLTDEHKSKTILYGVSRHWSIIQDNLTIFCHNIIFNSFLHMPTHFNIVKKRTFGKHCGKGEIAQNEQFHLIPQCFLCNLSLEILKKPHFSCLLRFL